MQTEENELHSDVFLMVLKALEEAMKRGEQILEDIGYSVEGF